MKVFAVPSLTSGTTAVLSVLFFTGLSHVYGDTMLGEIILVQASVALVQIACVPQCWVYVLGARNADDLRARYSQGLAAENAGIAVGLAVLLLLLALPISFVGRWSGAALLIYVSLAIQASSSCISWLRATERWKRYVLWNVGANLMRAPLIWATPALVRDGWLPKVHEPASVILLYFVAPDLIRWVVIYLPIATRNYVWPGFRATLLGTREIFKNWMYDLGSAVTDVADKVVVGALLGPQLLVVYFFARKLGVVVTMMTEPFYAEHYRRVSALADRSTRDQAKRRVYRLGLSLAAAVFVGLVMLVAGAVLLPPLAEHVPPSILHHMTIFVLVLLIDCAMTANRWSRYIAQLQGGSVRLLALRMTLFGGFAAGVAMFGNLGQGLGLCVVFGLAWVLEASFLSVWLQRSGPLARPTG